jgi:hypothetical protein
MQNPVQTAKADPRMDLRDAGQIAVSSFNAISPLVETGERGNPETGADWWKRLRPGTTRLEK